MGQNKLLLVNCPNRLSRVPEFFPYGAALLLNVLNKLKITADFFDLNLNRDIASLIKHLKKNDLPDIIALSGIITTYSFQISLSNIIREISPNSLIISGGGLASAVPELLLNNSVIDVACIGEGELIIGEIAKAWFDSKDLTQIKGIYWKDHQSKSIIKNALQPPINDLDSIPYPDWEGANYLFYLNQYSSFYNKGIKGRYFKRRGDLTSTRGCPHKCSFCSNIFSRQAIRSRSIENIIEEIRILKSKYNIDSIDFLDEDFCYSRNRVFDLCNQLLKNNIDISWGTASRVDNVDKELLQTMKKAGCSFILFGFETGSQLILNKMRKNISIDQSLNAFELTEEVGIDALGNLIIGHPGENDLTIKETLNFQKFRYNYLKLKYKNYLNQSEIKRDLLRRFSTVSFVVPFPGSQLYSEYKYLIGDLHSFMLNISLKDASDFTINLSEISTSKLLEYQSALSNPNYWHLIT